MDILAGTALKIRAEAGVKPELTQHTGGYAGAGCIFVQRATANDAIIVCPGIARAFSSGDVERWAAVIGTAVVFTTRLRQPLDAAPRTRDRA